MGAIRRNMWMQMIYGSSRTAVNNLIVAELQMYVCRAAIRRNMQMIYGSSRTAVNNRSTHFRRLSLYNLLPLVANTPLVVRMMSMMMVVIIVSTLFHVLHGVMFAFVRT